MQIAVVFFFIASFQWQADSAAINTDFVSPEELEAIRNGAKQPNRMTSKPKIPSVPSNPLPIKTTDRFDSDDDRPIWGSSSTNSANAQSHANNKHNGNDQSAGANSYNSNVVNENGVFHNSGTSSIGGNVSDDGKRAQLAASNSQKISSHTADGILSNHETQQSQSTNYDKDHGLLLTTDSKNSNKHTIDKTGEKREQSSGSSATNQNHFGSGNAIANTNSVDYSDQNGVKGNKKESTAQSTQVNKDGSISNSHTHSGTNTFQDKDGNEVSESKAGSTSSTQGQNGSSGSSSNCGSQGGQSNGGQSNGGQSNGFSSSFSSSSSSSFSNGNGQTFSNTGCQTSSKTGSAAPSNIHGPFVYPQFPIPHAIQYPYQFGGPFVQAFG